MQCSGESGSGWLRRLRSSRGFPADSAVNLEQFLNRPSSDLDDPPITVGENSAGDKDHVASEEISSGEQPGQDWYSMMTDVLSELFVMGGDDRSRRRKPSKAPRKQPRPSACVVSASASVGDSCAAAAAGGAAPSSAENSVAAEEENSQWGIEDWEAGSFSKTTVTVIDTSEPVWRSEKVLFRKGDDWKIFDRKGSSPHWSRKSRKLQSSEKGVGSRECRALLPNDDLSKKNRKQSIAKAAEVRRQILERHQILDTVQSQFSVTM